MYQSATTVSASLSQVVIRLVHSRPSVQEVVRLFVLIDVRLSVQDVSVRLPGQAVEARTAGEPISRCQTVRIGGSENAAVLVMRVSVASGTTTVQKVCVVADDATGAVTNVTAGTVAL